MDIFKAIDNRNLDQVKSIVKNGADINQTDADGRTPLMKASAIGRLDVVQFLVGRDGVDVNKTEDYGRTALMLASMGGHLEIVKILVDHGADLNKTNVNGRTALMLASMRNHLNVVKYLVEHGADLKITDNDGETAITIASKYSHSDIVKFFRKYISSIIKIQKTFRKSRRYAEWAYHPERLKAQGYFDKPGFANWRNGFGKKQLKVSLRSLMADIKFLSK